MQSSKKLYDWLMGNKVLGKYLYNYIHYKAIDKKTKIGSMLFLWCSLGVSAYLIENLYVRIFLMVVGIGVSIHILMLKTMDNIDNKDNKDIIEKVDNSFNTKQK